MRHTLTTAALAALGALALLPAPARAAFTLTATPSTAPAGGAGFFDVDVTNTGAAASSLSGFSFELAVAAASGVMFTGVDTATAPAPYVFGTLQSPPPFSFDAFPNAQFTASDDDAPGSTMINPGVTFGLGHVFYSVASGTAAGPVTVSFQDLGGGTSLVDPSDTAIPFTATNGTITVTPSLSAAPEPSGFAALGALGLGLGGLLLRARRRA